MRKLLGFVVPHKYRGQNFAPDIFTWRAFILCLACVFLFINLRPKTSVYSQSEDALLVQAPDTSKFPLVSVQFKLSQSIDLDENSLLMSQLKVLEDGQEITLQSLEKEQRGVHFTLAINGGREFDLRDLDGVSKFDKLCGVLKEWGASRVFSSGDMWSLETNGSLRVTNALSADDWFDALDSYDPDFRAMTSDLQSLSAAIQSAAERVVPFGVDKAVLYLTTAPTVEQIKEIYALAEMAKAAGVQVNVWMVSDPLFLSNDQGGALISLAESTGGTFFYFLGTEILPDPEALLSNHGFIYSLQYESLIRKAGTFPLQIEVNLRDRIIQGECPPFYLDIRPPEPVLVDPPRAVYREVGAIAETASGALVDESLKGSLKASLKGAMYPDIQFVKVKVGFPDGYPRQLVFSRLYVNGVVVTQQGSPPFDVLIWDLSDLIQSSEHLIQVEVIDSLGLTGKTSEYPIRVVVDLPEPEKKASVHQMTLIVGGGFLGLGAFSLLLWGAVRLRQRINLKTTKGIIAQQANEDESQKIAEPGQSFATLTPTTILGNHWEADAIRIIKKDGVFGSQIDKVDYYLKGDGVDGLQARLTLNEGAFWLRDQNSTLGTWVNYRRIGIEPVRIYPGDLIHFGDLGFRFTMIDRTLPDTAQITTYEPLV